ncbi:UNVERIFIED_CONTAM: hypothetical protein Sradi_5257800 [Sesamum radiatum]|uniref:Tf2-1-like SH3-like domain-containing protein n=1 Tax=Sesamum radiatum TaxID=300843 RepID=A0AAW2LMN1_SESRA
MKQQADRHRRDLDFSVGDWVLLRLQPYRQLSVQRRASQKLGRRFFGPFRILRRLGRSPMSSSFLRVPVFTRSSMLPYSNLSTAILPCLLWLFRRRRTPCPPGLFLAASSVVVFFRLLRALSPKF